MSNLQHVQDLVHSENTDVVFVNKTWLNQDIESDEVLSSGFNVFRKYQQDQAGGGDLITAKTEPFISVAEFSLDPAILQLFEELEIVSAEVTTIYNQKIIFSSIYWPEPENKLATWL